MSQYSGTEHTAPGGEVIDLTSRLTPAALARVGESARETTHTTPAGVADMATGTLRLPDGAVLEQLPDHTVGKRPPATFTSSSVLARTARTAGRSARVCVIGARIATRDAWSYVFATEYGQLIDQVRRTGAGPEHIADLRADRRKAAAERRREPLVVYGATGATTYAAALVGLAQAWSIALVAPALLPLFAVLYALGRREIARATPDGQGVYTITDVPAPPAIEERSVLGADSINAALRRAGVMKDGQEVALVGPARAVEIHASEAVMELPGDLTISDLEKNRHKIAAAFRVEPTWIDFRAAGHPGCVVLWIASQDPFGEARPSPLLAAPQRTDVWNHGIPLGYNRRGQTISMRLRHVMALLGGASRTGKGMALRSLICGLGLDPRVNIRLAAGAKPGEHRGYAPVCATFFGRRPERLIHLLDALIAEAKRREEYLEDQGRAKLSEKDLDQFPLEVVIIDEYKQYATTAVRLEEPGDSEGKTVKVKAADRIEQQIEELAAFAAALNITLLLSTQDPDAATTPRGYKNNSGARAATRTMSAAQTNAILRDGATGAGLRAHDIPAGLKGGTIVDMDGAEGELIRTFFIEDEAFDGAEPIIAAGRALREQVGRAPGQFADPIEEYLLKATGESSVGGGPTGSGRPGPPAGGRVGQGVIGLILQVFEEAGDPAHLRTPDVLAGLARVAPESWAAVAAGDPRQAGRKLAEAIKATGRELAAVEKSWGRGYLLDDVRAAAGIAPV